MKPTLLILTAAALLVSCKENTTTTTAAETPAAAGPGTAVIQVLEAAPEGEALQIHVLRETAQPGDTVTISGRIMGNSAPFVEGRAAFILADPEVLTACSDMPGDNCETPWDACCDSKEDKKRGVATIQIVGADGRVLKEGLDGVGGLAKLAKVTVSGKVAPGSSKDSLVINATAIRPVQ